MMEPKLRAAESAMIAAKDSLDRQYWIFSRCAKGSPLNLVDLKMKYNEAREKYMAIKRESK